MLQSLLRNPLADPFILGVASGASTGAVSIAVLGIGAGTVGLTAGAFVGAGVAFGLVLLLATAARGGIDRMILAGVAATQLFSALTSFIVFTSADAEQTRGVLFWLLGSLSSASWRDVVVCGALVVTGVVVCLGCAGTLDAFLFGQDAASALGVPVVRIRMLLVLTALAARAISSGVRLAVSRPARWRSRLLAPSRSPADKRSWTAAASRSSERPPSTAQVTVAVNRMRSNGLRVERSTVTAAAVTPPSRTHK